MRFISARLRSAILIALMCVTGVAAQEKVSETIKTLLISGQFEPYSSVANLPEGVQNGLNRLFKTHELKLADPGDEFQITDEIVDPDLPGRRLEYAECSADLCLVCYERGGIALIQKVVLFRIGNGEAEFMWGGRVSRELPASGALKDAIVSGRINASSGDW